MADGNIRKCDDGVMKLPKCKYHETNLFYFVSKDFFNVLHFVDFQTKMICSSPFKMFKNVGCVFLYQKNDFTFDQGLSYCQSLGGEVFEFEDFSRQYEDVYYFLVSHGGTYCILPLRSPSWQSWF